MSCSTKANSRLVFFLLFYIYVFFLGIQNVQSQNCVSEPVEIGFRDFSYNVPGITAEITEEKPESKLWYNDGSWWGVLFDPDSNKYRIHKFDSNNQCFQSVGPNVDDRLRSSQDVLWDGEKLYIASRAKLIHKPEHGPDSARVYRYSYNSVTGSFSLDPDFPVNINSTKSKSLTIANAIG